MRNTKKPVEKRHKIRPTSYIRRLFLRLIIHIVFLLKSNRKFSYVFFCNHMDQEIAALKSFLVGITKNK